MTRRSGQIIEKGPRKYLVRVFLERDASGKRVYASKLVHGGKKAAQRALTQMLADKSAGVLAPRSKDTLDAFLDDWIVTTVTPSVRPQTRSQYEQTLRRYVRPHLGAVPLTQITAADVRGLCAKLTAAGLSPRTVRSAHECLRNALEQAVLDKIIPSNPARSRAVQKALPKVVRGERVTIPADRIAGFLDVVLGDPTAAYWVLLLFSGLRPEEALGLRWADIRGETVHVSRVLVRKRGDVPMHIAEPKSASSRRAVPVPTIVTRALTEHRKRQAAARLAAGADWQDNGLAFCDATGGFLPQSRMHTVFKRLLSAAELPSMRIYDLRHSCATLLLEGGVPLKIVSERLGHATIGLTGDTYSHVSETMQQQAVDVLEKLWQ
ncbi:MAG TPA: tyrosine-type recombinase/integrase [Longimicrobiales bacterium]|nr:tyrosine-type recombinase/integrase [Longimicrobiales bacterium]